MVLEKHKMVRMTDNAGQRCNSLLRKLAGIDPSNQLSTAPAVPNLMRNACAISIIKTQLEMPLASSAEVGRGFTSLMAVCRTTVSITSPGAATQWVISMSSTSTSKTGTATSSRTTISSTAAASCQGKPYTIRDGDTCSSVSLSQRISTTRLLMANNLRADCANLDRQPAGYTVCLSPPRGSWVNPHASSSANATTTSVDCQPANHYSTIFTLSMTPIPTSYINSSVTVSPIAGFDD
ncbi:carbohydrate-binding module family 50 protein [Parathielavia appendiculata]|uniref:Carbohydrate-binding module family 50 protein n=1 Tax=Parathielavia appendiculata TaxID=2587402 RepID=A0AAN6UCP5_9PEZI|nr:carbohydrate-binding module family 50 protein [Parathielavia appendiculata]